MANGRIILSEEEVQQLSGCAPDGPSFSAVERDRINNVIKWAILQASIRKPVTVQVLVDRLRACDSDELPLLKKDDADNLAEGVHKLVNDFTVVLPVTVYSENFGKLTVKGRWSLFSKDGRFLIPRIFYSKTATDGLDQLDVLDYVRGLTVEKNFGKSVDLAVLKCNLMDFTVVSQQFNPTAARSAVNELAELASVAKKKETCDGQHGGCESSNAT